MGETFKPAVLDLMDMDEMIPDEQDLGILCDDNQDIGPLVEAECQDVDPEIFDDIFDDLEIFLFGEKLKKEEKPKKKRKVKNESLWKRNQRKIKHEAGEEYVSARGKIVQAKTLMTKKDCLENCKYNCNILIDETTRREIFVAFYRLPTNAKYQYILNTSEQVPVKNPHLPHYKNNNYSFWFFIEKVAVKVCKVFYLTTLNISAKVVYGCHERKDHITGLVTDMRGRHGKQRKYADDAKDLIREHIKSFPVVNAHYSQSNTQRKFLDPGLTISKMFKLYEELCEAACVSPLPLKSYSKIFNEEFALSFVVPKKKRCDTCVGYEMAVQEKRVTDEMTRDYKEHEIEKNALKRERETERKCGEAVLSFDMQNVICCPKADVNTFYYKSKLNVYLLTAHLSKGNQVYCVLWNEILADDAGNDLASALTLVLEKVFSSNKYLTTMTIWSETCLPKNRNAILSYAILDFLKKHENFKHIILKYSIKGHTTIQEVYNIQAGITTITTSTDFYSPITLLELMKNLRKKKPYHLMQMTKEQVKNFGECAKLLKYERVPFNEILYLKISKCFHVKFKVRYEGVLESASISPPEGSLIVDQGTLKFLQSPNDMPEPPILGLNKNFPAEKVESIRSMYEKMPKQDMDYFELWFKELGYSQAPEIQPLEAIEVIADINA